MKAIILGAGRIGRGFVTELMTLNNIQVTFFDAMPAMVESLNRETEYTIHVLAIRIWICGRQMGWRTKPPIPISWPSAGRRQISYLQPAEEKI